MAFLRPEPMAKIGLIGLKDDRETILSLLHDLNVLEITPIGAAALQHMTPERGDDAQRAVGEQLIRFRSLKSSLPAVPNRTPTPFNSLTEVLTAAKAVTVDASVSSLKKEEDQLLTERKGVADQVELLGRYRFYGDRLDYLHGKSVLSFFGETTPEQFDRITKDIPQLSDAHFLTERTDKQVRFIVVVRRELAEAVSRLAQQTRMTLQAAPRISGTSADALPALQKRLHEIDRRLESIRDELGALAREWSGKVLAIEEALTIESRKLDIYTRLGVGNTTFALEGWVPKRERPRLEAAIAGATAQRTIIYEPVPTEEPPTMMHNPAGVRRYEFFIRFYSLPQALEWDPTWVFALVFPIFFGFMLADWGYGLTILLVSLWMLAGFPGGRFLPGAGRRFVKMIVGPSGMRQLAWAILPGTVIAIGLGIYFNEFFGFHVLPFSGPDPASAQSVSKLLLIAGYIGLGMVTLGFALGALKEYFHHHPKGALGKVGGILFAWAIALFGLAVLRHQIPITGPALSTTGLPYLIALIVGLVVMIGAEGLMTGVMGLIEIVSHILSYTRLVGILLASVILAVVIIKMGQLADTNSI
ncbi:MAG: hypothetical protein L3K09_01785, partial [Thermoplasmata archaeon]|nr:hypothetical protein [Thermoplasmata archaeon]